jgi:hypothetical protein
VQKILTYVWNEGKGFLSYSEFLLATIDLKKELTEEVLSNVFSHFDRRS